MCSAIADIHAALPQKVSTVLPFKVTNTGRAVTSRKFTSQHGRFATDIGILSDASPRFAAHVEIAKPWWHHLVYLIVDLKGTGSGEYAVHLADLLASASAKDICNEVLGARPVGLLTILGKIRAYPLPEGYYVKLMDTLALSGRLKLLLHQTNITPDLIDVLMTLPDEVVSAKLVSALKNLNEARCVAYYIDALLSIFPAGVYPRIWASVRKLSNFEDLEKWSTLWIERAPAPAMPWSGNALLRPIETPSDLVAAGREFQNCLRGYVPSMVAGQVSFYRWLGGAPAIAALRRDFFCGWVLAEVETVGNAEDFSASGQAEIIEQFANAGYRYRPRNVGEVLSNIMLLF
ncbi:hypothetical protein DBT53_000740, partial [Aerococcus mictus]|uniref:hypothetical protein n=2 Tax=Aerococcus TaxID=1375 RepID=UPI002FD43DBA